MSQHGHLRVGAMVDKVQVDGARSLTSRDASPLSPQEKRDRIVSRMKALASVSLAERLHMALPAAQEARGVLRAKSALKALKLT